MQLSTKKEVGEMKLFTFQDGKVKRYFVRKNNKIELTKDRYIATPNWFPAHLKFPYHVKHIKQGILIYVHGEDQWYLLPEGGGDLRDFSTLVIAKEVTRICNLSGVEVVYSSDLHPTSNLGEKKVFLLKFAVNGHVIIDRWYVFWDYKDLNVIDVASLPESLQPKV